MKLMLLLMTLYSEEGERGSSVVEWRALEKEAVDLVLLQNTDEQNGQEAMVASQYD